MLGKIIINLLLAISITSIASYILSYIKLKKDENKVVFYNIGNFTFHLLFFGIIFISSYFFYCIINHQFQYTYVWSYTSKDLPFMYLLSSFYAGQEGSFLLWTILIAFVGFIFNKNTKDKTNHAVGMIIFLLIIALFLSILVAKSPFNFLWESFNDKIIQKNVIPHDGRGLNPVLENFWLIIHPPILFLGYSIMIVPYILAITALIKNNYTSWIEDAIKWNIVASVFLGLGIILGGFWAYESLGWGGFWGWDPVENSSLIPWLISLTLIHTYLIQKKTGGLVKTNFILTIFGLVTIFYSTFLTRSGILSKFSVHSFAEVGSTVYSILFIIVIVFLLIGLVLFFIKFKELRLISHSFHYFSKEFILFLGSVILLLISIIIFYGTNFPIFASMVGRSTFYDSTFYVQKNYPFVIIMLLINALSIYLNWKINTIEKFFKRLIIPIVVSLIITVIIYNNGIEDISDLIMLFSAVFSIYINLEFIVKIIYHKSLAFGGFLSHIGVGLLIIGALASGAYSSSQTIRLVKNKEQSALNYKFLFNNSISIDSDKKNKEKYKYEILVKNNNNTKFAYPTISLTDYNQRQATFNEPYIINYFSHDLYISPNSITENIDAQTYTFYQQTTQFINPDSSIKFTFVKFDMAQAQKDVDSNNSFINLGAIIEVQYSNNQFQKYLDTLITKINMADMSYDPLWKEIKHSNLKAGFIELIRTSDKLGSSHIVIGVNDKDRPDVSKAEILTIDATIKPFILFVWIGAIFIVLGIFLSLLNHRKK